MVKDNIRTGDQEQPIERMQWAVKFLKIKNKKMKETLHFLKAQKNYELSDEEAKKEKERIQERINQERKRLKKERERLKEGAEHAKGGSEQPSTGAGGKQEVQKKRKGKDVVSDPKRPKE